MKHKLEKIEIWAFRVWADPAGKFRLDHSPAGVATLNSLRPAPQRSAARGPQGFFLVNRPARRSFESSSRRAVPTEPLLRTVRHSREPASPTGIRGPGAA